MPGPGGDDELLSDHFVLGANLCRSELCRARRRDGALRLHDLQSGRDDELLRSVGLDVVNKSYLLIDIETFKCERLDT